MNARVQLFSISSLWNKQLIRRYMIVYVNSYLVAVVALVAMIHNREIVFEYIDKTLFNDASNVYFSYRHLSNGTKKINERYL